MLDSEKEHTRMRIDIAYAQSKHIYIKRNNDRKADQNQCFIDTFPPYLCR
jgi:hypothetical protein